MKNEKHFKESFVSTLKDIFNKFPDKWEASSSQDCFILFLTPDAFTISNYLNSDNAKSIDIATLDSRGAIRNEVTINEEETADLYSSVFEIYKKIKSQVEINKLNNMNNSLKAESSHQSAIRG